MPAQIAHKPQRNVQNMQAGVRGTARLGDVPGSEKIISVTDRTVGPSASAGEQQTVAAESATEESSRPLPASGWTARRPTTELQR
jgi:hypothetical protein